MNKRKELKVSALENGTVIDHIPPGNVFDVIRILNLNTCEEQITFGTNLDSKKFGKKGVIKVANRFFESHEINKIALIAPTATLIIIKNFKVTEKNKVEIPDEIRYFVRCVNPNCITNVEDVDTKFEVLQHDKGHINLKCHYCERVTKEDSLAFN